MTPADLRALIEAATPGPWEANILSDANFIPRAEPSDATEFFAVGPRIRDGQTTIRVRDRSGLQQASTDAVLIAALRNLGPELLALWEQCQFFGLDIPALRALNAKAEGM